MVLNVAKVCKSQLPDPDGSFFSAFEDLQKVWPHSLELIIFPYELPEYDYENEDCAAFEEAAKKTGRSIRVMEMVEFNGPSDEIHPVYRYFKSKARLENIHYDFATAFLVNPDASFVEVHQAPSGDILKKYLARIFDKEL